MVGEAARQPGSQAHALGNPLHNTSFLHNTEAQPSPALGSWRSRTGAHDAQKERFVVGVSAVGYVIPFSRAELAVCSRACSHSASSRAE